MKKNVDLLNGSIAGAISKLALPIMGTSFIQMAYNLTDMLWIGKIGSGAVASVGAAGMYMWLSEGFIMLARMGGQVLAGQSLGAGDIDKASAYSAAALQMGLMMGLVYSAVSILCCRPMIGFFRLTNPQVISDAKNYLVITCGLIFFNFLNHIVTGLLTAMGNSMLTFRSTTVGLLINLVLDPFLIFGIGPLPSLKVTGAAIATVFAQIIVFTIYFIHIYKDPILFSKKYLAKRPSGKTIRKIFGIGFPAALHSLWFTVISMTIARLVAGWGDAAIAVQKVGTQIESISWMTSEGFGSAVNAFTAQNYGAGKNRRVKKGFSTSLFIVGSWGILTTFALTVFPKQLFSLFISEAPVIPLGVSYLKILGVSQLFVCVESVSTGVFQGLGKSIPPSFTGIFFTGLRIPAALFLSSTPLGLNGIWWSISISSFFKGSILSLWLAGYIHLLLKGRHRPANQRNPGVR